MAGWVHCKAELKTDSSAVSSYTEVCLWVSLEKNSEYAVWAHEEQQTLLAGMPRGKKNASFDKRYFVSNAQIVKALKD